MKELRMFILRSFMH